MRYDRGYRYRPRYAREFDVESAGRYDRSLRTRYGADYWWIGEHAIPRSRRDVVYDESYRRFSDANHPRFTPVGGMYAAMGGSYSFHRPRPLREPAWFSDWTRWF